MLLLLMTLLNLAGNETAMKPEPSPASRYDPSVIDPTEDYPYGPSCAVVSSELVSLSPPRLQYQVDVYNMCDRKVYDKVVRVSPVDSVHEYWNVDYDGESTFNFPQWASIWGIYPNSSLSFGFVSNVSVQVI